MISPTRIGIYTEKGAVDSWVLGVTQSTPGTRFEEFYSVWASSEAIIAAGNYQDGSSVYHGAVVCHDAGGDSMFWARSQTLAAEFRSTHVAFDGDNVYVLGYGRPSGTYNSAYLLKYSSAGSLQWQRKIAYAGSTSNRTTGLIVHSDGYIYAAITASGSIKYGYVVKYNDSGALQWQKRLTATDFNQITSIRTLSDGKIGVVGGIGSSVNMVTPTFVKMNTDGTIAAKYGISDTASPSGFGLHDVAEDASGNCYFTAARTISTTNQAVIKLTSAGALSAAKQFGFGSTSSLIINDGYIYVCGTFLMRLDTALSIIWARSTAGISSVSAFGSVLVCAGYGEIGDTGNDAIIMRLPNNGGGLGSYGYITYDGSVTPTVADITTLSVIDPTITSETSSLTESAGDVTDAAYSNTTTKYTRS